MTLLISNTCLSQEPALMSGTLQVKITNIRSNHGNIIMGIYDNAAQWTNDPHYSLCWNKDKMCNGTLLLKVDSLPYGKYSIAVLDDEDRSGTMNCSLGLPREGWGMSTNPSFFTLKAPDYESIAIELKRASLYLEIKMNYLNKSKKLE